MGEQRMIGRTGRRETASGPSRMPAHIRSGAALLALELAEAARGMRGLDVLRRSVDRAPPAPA